MKKSLPIILTVFFFIGSLLYLHQKIQIYVEAYKLGNEYSQHNELLDKRDYLMYNFSKEISLAKVNKWAQDRNFTPIGKERLFIMDIKIQPQVVDNKIALLFNRFLWASTSTPTALAKEKR